jgi:hypothetical protein
MTTSQVCRAVPGATRELVDWVRDVRASAPSPFAAARRIVRRLGAHPDAGRAALGFWIPSLLARIPVDRIRLEVLTPLEELDLQTEKQSVSFRRERLELVAEEGYVWVVVEGMVAGTRERIGTFYWLAYREDDGAWHHLPDPMAASLPFGAFAPAELYDLAQLDRRRADRDHFSQLEGEIEEDGVLRVGPPVNILQLHVRTASAEGTLAGLASVYRRIGAKLESGRPLTPAEENYAGYDAVQLMPVEPTVEFENGPRFWQPVEDDPEAQSLTVRLQRPSMTNWGYDILISGSPAVNPALLETGRPDELVDFIAALHNFPGGPIGVLFDIVYGHADNQALPILDETFFAGPGMYGQEMNFSHPVVRAILLEMQRRKNDFGVDGVRVDGAQDFKVWDPEAQAHYHDDEFLLCMNDIVQEVAGQRYRPWMIFEDGRPWPRDDWELASTYREVTRQMDNVFQWGPLTFAHNTPFLFTFWIGKWWRIEEMTRFGGHWITGCANHDTLRRGTQVDPEARINTYLGETLPEILRNAYDNPAAKLFDYACMPGVPMDFINASMRAPWSFIRNTDDRYGVKVMSEEARFLDWAVAPERFADPEVFPRLKALGFTERDALHRFVHALPRAVALTGYDLDQMVQLLRALDPPLAGPPLTPDALKSIASAWMDDVHDYCNVDRYADELDAQRTGFNLRVRAFRRARPWLMVGLGPDEAFDYLRPCDGSVIFYGLRRAPDDGEQVLFVANMEGEPRAVEPLELPIADLPGEGWRVALATPGLKVVSAAKAVELANSEGVVFTRAAET